VAPNRVVLADSSNADGKHWRAVTYDGDGTLRIEGHDLGPGVEDFWGSGYTEYEFERMLRPPEVERLRDLLGLGPGENLLEVLATRFEATSAIEKYLEEHGLESEFWSRVGE